MVLPVYLAMTGAEMLAIGEKNFPLAWMSCHFSPYHEGITNLPGSLPQGSMLILDDSTPCRGHSRETVAQQLCEAAHAFQCESVLLDFQRAADPESMAMAHALVAVLPCPTAVSARYAENIDAPVLLPPAPLHIPLAEYLKPWNDRDIWLEVAFCQETISLTETGAVFMPQFPTDGLDGGFYDKILCCNHTVQVEDDLISFTLFDTPDTLPKKLSLAAALGVSRGVGLYQELSFYGK